MKEKEVCILASPCRALGSPGLPRACPSVNSRSSGLCWQLFTVLLPPSQPHTRRIQAALHLTNETKLTSLIASFPLSAAIFTLPLSLGNSPPFIGACARKYIALPPSDLPSDLHSSNSSSYTYTTPPHISLWRDSRRACLLATSDTALRHCSPIYRSLLTSGQASFKVAHL